MSLEDDNRSANEIDDENKESKVELHESLDEYDLEILHDIFTKQGKKGFDAVALRDILEGVGKIKFSDEDYNVIFMRMNTSRYIKSQFDPS